VNTTTRNARLIVSARLVSDFGAFLNMVALATYVYLLSNSPMSVGIFLASRVAGGVFASLIGTAFYRRWAGRMPLIVFDLLRAGLLGLLLVLPVAQQVLLLPVIAFGLGFGNSMFAIGLNSQLPNLIKSEQLLKTNAWITSASSAAMVAGSLVAGLLVAAFGFETVFALNVVTYLLAALLIVPLRFSTQAPDAGTNHGEGEWSALRHGLRGTPVVAAMLAVTMADTLGSAAHNVGFPIISKLLTPESASTTLGLMLAVWASGKFIGARIASRLKGSDNINLERRFFFGVLLMSCGFILMFQQQTLYGLLLFSLPAGLGDGFSESRTDVAPAAGAGASAPADFQLSDAAANDRFRHRHADRRAVLFVVDTRCGGVAVPRHSPHHFVGGEGAVDQEWAGSAQQPDARLLRIGQSGRWSP